MTVVTAKQMKQIEMASLEYDLTFARLMENAGSAAAAFIRRTLPPQDLNCMVFCGSGNNGGDGFVVARRLHENGANVLVVLAGGEIRSEESNSMFAMLELLELPVFDMKTDYTRIASCIAQADIIVDAIYGTGFHGSLGGLALAACQLINDAIAAVVSLDLPSGVHCDMGLADPHAVKADFTVSFDSLKPLHIMPSCKEHCGVVEVVDIGIPPEAHDGIEYVFGTISEDMAFGSLPPRMPDTHKGNYGRVLAICGSNQYRGAAVMAVTAVMRAGAGLCCLAATEPTCAAAACAVPEAILLPLPSTPSGLVDTLAATPLLIQELKQADAVLFGCGLGDSPQTAELLGLVLKKATCPVIIDADGLNALSANIHLLQEAKAGVTLTPHPGEMAKLCGKTIDEVQADRQLAAMGFSSAHKVTVVLKGHRTLVAPAGGGLYINPTGGPGMAKAGSGDILAGMLAGFTAQGIPQPAVPAVYLHGLAGDRCAIRRSEYAMLPSEMLEDLCQILSEVQRQT